MYICDMKEIWRKVIIYDKANNEYVDLGEWYLVNQYGDIYSKRKNKLLKHNILWSGYHMVRLRSNNKSYDKLVHNVVGWTFPDICGKYEPGLQINHKDENKDNNNAINLEWCTGSYNVNYGTGSERMMETREKNGDVRRRRKVNQIEDGIIIHTWNSEIEAQRSGKGYDCGCISRCCRGILKQHKGFQWQYAT